VSGLRITRKTAISKPQRPYPLRMPQRRTPRHSSFLRCNVLPDSAFIDLPFREAKSGSFERKLAWAIQQCLIEVAQPSQAKTLTRPAADKKASGKKPRRAGRGAG